MRLIPLLVAGTVVMTAPLAAQQRGTGGGMRSMAAMNTWNAFATAFDSTATAASLTEDQQNMVLLLMTDIRDEHGEALNKIARLREDMRAARTSGGGREAMMSIMQQLGPTMEQLTPVMEEFEQELQGTLNNDQRDALETFVQSRNRFGRRPRGGGGGGG